MNEDTTSLFTIYSNAYTDKDGTNWASTVVRPFFLKALNFVLSIDDGLCFFVSYGYIPSYIFYILYFWNRPSNLRPTFANFLCRLFLFYKMYTSFFS